MPSETETVPDGGAPAAPFDGDKVGRYVLLRELGRGAMGQVFGGFDPDLSRPVAVKVVADGNHTLAPWLVREARTQANLSHPNIVPVFDVGLEADRVFIVMELVDGGSLAEWLETRPRSKREILRAWCAAGRGLAAAHAAGVVHRDFKASNVLIAKDGHVRVADFGLARPPDADADATNPVEGTLPYFAPEVIERGAATEAVDQYAYCVSLHHALCGAYPEGHVVDPRIARNVRGVIARGLATRPDDRWPSMTALVDALERAQRAPRIVIAAIAAVVLAGGAVGLVALRSTAGASCAVGADVVARTVTPAQRQRLTAALRDSGIPRAAEVATHVEQQLTAGLAAWTARYERACPRSACLEARLGDLAMELDDAIAEHGAAMAEVPALVAKWTDALGACTANTPVDPSQVYRHAMARALDLSRLGRADAALAAAGEAIAAASDSRSAIRAKLRRITVEDDAARVTAARLAELPDLYAAAQRETSDPELAGEVALTAAEACMHTNATCAEMWIGHLGETVARLPATTLRADLAGVRGELAMMTNNPAAAIAMFEDEIRLRAADRGADSFALLPGLVALAGALSDMTRHGEAAQVAARADAIVVKWLGERHPYRVAPLSELAIAKLMSGDVAAASDGFERAIALRAELEGADSPRLANLYNNLAAAYQTQGRLGPALDIIDRSIAIFVKTPTLPVAARIARMRSGAVIAAILARDDAASRIASAFDVARGIADDDAVWAGLHLTRGMIAFQDRRIAAAETDLRAASARFAKHPDAPGPDRITAAGYLVLLAITKHDVAGARRLLATAVELGTRLPARDLRRGWLVELGAEVAIAGGDDAGARTQLATIEPLVAAATSEPRFASHYHLLLALLAHRAHDAAAEAKQRELADAALRAGGIPEGTGARDCAVCSSVRPM